MNRFDTFAGVWDEKPERIRGARNIYEAICEKVKISGNETVADYGTGTGLLLIHFQQVVKEIHGYDNSLSMLSELEQKIQNHTLENVKTVYHDADFEDLPSQKFDLFVSSMTFHHISNISEFIGKAYKSLKSGGKFAIADLETEDGTFHSDPDESIKHLGFDKNEFAQIMEKTGFTAVECKTIFSIPKEDKSYNVFLAYGEKA